MTPLNANGLTSARPSWVSSVLNRLRVESVRCVCLVLVSCSNCRSQVSIEQTTPGRQTLERPGRMPATTPSAGWSAQRQTGEALSVASPVWAEPDAAIRGVAQEIVRDYASVTTVDHGERLDEASLHRLNGWLDPRFGIWVRWDVSAIATSVYHYSSFSELLPVVQAVLADRAAKYLPKCLDRVLAQLPPEPLCGGPDQGICRIGGIESLGRRSLALNEFPHYLSDPEEQEEARRADEAISHFIYVRDLGLYLAKLDSRWRVLAIDIERCKD